MYIFSFFLRSLLNKYGEMFSIGCEHLPKKDAKAIMIVFVINIKTFSTYFHILEIIIIMMLKFLIFIFGILLHYTLAEVRIQHLKSNRI